MQGFPEAGYSVPAAQVIGQGAGGVGLGSPFGGAGGGRGQSVNFVVTRTLRSEGFCRYIYSMIRLTIHARQRMAEYQIALGWVKAAISAPDGTAPDPRLGITRSFKVVPARGGRVLRVAHRADGADVIVLSAHFNRGAKP